MTPRGLLAITKSRALLELVQESGLIKPSKLAELSKEANGLGAIVVAARKTAKLAA